MSQLFVLQPNEQILFKHSASYNKCDGSLYVSNLRLVWDMHVGASGSGTVEKRVLTWSNIETVKYSPPAHKSAMVNVLSTTKDSRTGENQYIFTLIGPNQEHCRRELDRLKSIIKDIRDSQQSSNSAANSIASQIENVNKRPGAADVRIKDLLGKTSSESIKKDLLNADASLLKEYNELVRDGKILTDDQFWKTRSHLLIEKEAAKYATEKGMVSELLSDTREVDQNGNKRLTLTAEMIHRIFLMYPTVKNLYSQKVPLEMTETEFWTKYFQSEYFNRDKGHGLGSKFGDDLTKVVNTIATDDIFSRTADEEKAKQSQKSKAPRISEKVSSDIDLTRDYGDYHHNEIYNVFPQTKQPATLITKYNKNSNIVMETGSVHVPDSFPQDTCQLPELQAEKQPDYLPLHLEKDDKKHIKKENACSVSSLNKRKFLKEDVVFCFMSAIPSAKEAVQVLRDLTKECNATTAVARQEIANMKKSLGSETNVKAPMKVNPVLDTRQVQQNNNNSLTLTNEQEFIDIPPDFRLYIYERFARVAELLRHFYSNVRMRNNEERTRKINDALQEQLNMLSIKKNEIQGNPAIDKVQKANCFRCIKDVNELIYRANSYWECSQS